MYINILLKAYTNYGIVKPPCHTYILIILLLYLTYIMNILLKLILTIINKNTFENHLKVKR